MQKSTRKKVKIIGTKTYIDQKTGEIKDVQVIDIEERDANFYKIWLMHIIQAMDLIGNQKIRFAFWLIEQMNTANQITLTLRQMASKSGISYDTVLKTVNVLIKCDFLIKYNWGVYQVNPEIIFKGGSGHRLHVMLDYSNKKSENDNQ